MRIAVLGSGVIGVTSAWYLAEAGHEVVVVDRQTGPAMETSFANAGEISPGCASPWAAPGIPMKAAKWLFMKHAPLILRPSIDMAMFRWLLAMLGNCTSERYLINKARMLRLARFGRERLIDLRSATGIQYDERSQGTLQLFRDPRQLDAVDKDVAVLRADGIPFEVLDRDGCIRAEPGLAWSETHIAGGLRLPQDETGDCHQFTHALVELGKKKGIRFEYGRIIRRLAHEAGRISHVETSAGPITADAYLVALGSYTPLLVRALGLKVPVYPVKGYSLTLAVSDEAQAPVSTLLDETYKVAITRLGNRIRVGGMAELSGFSHQLPDRRRATLEHSVTSLFPGAADLSEKSFWCGLRPTTPDSTPIIGPTSIPNLYLNTGHGTLGWTMSCGSGHIIADIMSGRTPAIRTDDLSLERYRS